jgi:hypothetical protein
VDKEDIFANSPKADLAGETRALIAEGELFWAMFGAPMAVTECCARHSVAAWRSQAQVSSRCILHGLCDISCRVPKFEQL